MDLQEKLIDVLKEESDLKRSIELDKERLKELAKLVKSYEKLIEKAKQLEQK